jgi:hypothetical protein
MLSIDVEGTNRQIEQSVVKPLGELNDASRQALENVLAKLEEELVARARAKASGEVLQIRSGRFVESIQGEVTQTAHGVLADVFSRDRRAGLLEYGGRIPPHEIDPAYAHALHFLGRFAARVHSPGATIAPHPTIHAAYEEMRARIYEDVENNVNTVIYQHMSAWEVALGLSGAAPL